MAKKTIQPSDISHPDHSLVAARAYEIWQREGCPDGRAMEHWLRAEVEVAGASSLASEENLRARSSRRPAVRNGDRQFQAAGR